MNGHAKVALKWGGVKFRIEAPSHLISRVKQEYAHFLRDESDSTADALVLRVYAEQDERLRKEIAGGLRMGPILLHGGGVLFEDGIVLKNYAETEDALIVHAQLGTSSKRKKAQALPSGIQRVLNMRYATVEELEYIDFVYGVMMPSLQLAMLKRNNSFLHSSAVYDEEHSGAIVFGSWGGIGKTSLSASLLLNDDRFSFISDDQTLISADGHVFATPLGVHLYPYNTRTFPEIQRRLWDGRGWLDRSHWVLRDRLFGPAGVVRRVSPRTLYSRTHENAPVAAAIWLERNTEIDRAQVKPMVGKDFAFRSAHVTMHEFRRLVKLFIGVGTVGAEVGGLSSIADLFNKVRDVYLSCFNNVPVLRVTVPQGWHAEELGGFIKENVLDKGLW